MTEPQEGSSLPAPETSTDKALVEEALSCINTHTQLKPVPSLKRKLCCHPAAISPLYEAPKRTWLETPRPTNVAPKRTWLEAPRPTWLESPSTSVEESPTTSAEESPTTSVKELPTTSVEVTPSTSAEESPTTSVEEAPTMSVEELPTTSAKESPTTSVEESPTTSAKDEYSELTEEALRKLAEKTLRKMVEEEPRKLVEEAIIKLVEEAPRKAVEESFHGLTERKLRKIAARAFRKLVEEAPRKLVEDTLKLVQETLKLAEEPPKNLRSRKSKEKCFVLFVNCTHRKIDVCWINFNGISKKYKTLYPGNQVEIQTYVTHPWVFRDTETRAAFVMDSERVFFPKPILQEELTVDDEVSFHHPPVFIYSPFYTLKALAAQVVGSLLPNPEDAYDLIIPRVLMNTVAKSAFRKHHIKYI
ncbi:uncharacterized protein LOC121867735 isoform X2 [Homarus americanus]|uniref:uncharacterized protein LOC121867735 isoform X2 n=1 Tax=Homarus americanus TaxID=6706 RepID=UPI001C454ABA|nr:uncharacterized protein LOC121867735 isoform X2 [Homarus americanus]